VTRCAACDYENEAEARFCSRCGRRLRGVEGERKQVTVLFADVKGSMDMSRAVDAEQWWTLMQEVFALMSDGAKRFGGSVGRFTGDGIMAVFGVPHAIEDHARRACQAAMWMRSELDCYREQLRTASELSLEMRIGLNSGEVVAGTIGGELDPEYATIGYAAGLAQRMESLAEPGGIYLTEATAKLVDGFFRLTEQDPAEVKGGGGPLRIFELAGDEELQTQFDLARVSGLSRFVGREHELTILEDALNGTLAGRGQVLTVVAPAGTGKSRLCFEFLEGARARGIEVWQGHAAAHTSGVPFGTALEVLRDYFDISRADGELHAREKVLARLASAAVDLDDALPLLLDMLGIASPESEPAVGDPEARQRRLFSAIERLVRANATVAPSVILVEDLHWIDSASAAMLGSLAAAVEHSRTLLLSTSRPEHRVPWTSLPYCRELRLAPLDRDESRALLAGRLGADRSLDGLADLVYEHADGNPFFIEEIVKALADSDTLEGAPGAYRLTRTVEEVQIPPTVESVLAARIDRLSEDEKSALQAAAVVGHQFSEPVLQRVSGQDGQQLAESLEGLLSAELILPGSTPHEYRHKHALAERVAYRSQLQSHRAPRHAAAAEAIAETAGDRLDERAALIAEHWERAGEPIRAAQWSARAAAWAMFKDPSEALRQWRRAGELADAAPDSPARVELALGTRVARLNLAWRLGVPDGATREEFELETAELYREASEIARRVSNEATLTLTLAAYGAVRGIGGHLEDMAELGMRAVELAEQLGDGGLRLNVLPCPVYGLFGLGRYSQMLSLLERQLADLPEDPEQVGGITLVCPYASVLCWLAAAQAQTGSLPEAFAGFERALTLAREHEDFETESFVEMSIVQAMELAGDGPDVLEHARQAMNVAEHTGGAFSIGLAWRYLGIAFLLRAEWRESIEALETALATWRPRQVGLEAEPQALAMLARAQLGLGAAATALQTAHEALSLAVSRGTMAYEIEARLALVEILRTIGGDQAATIEAHLLRAGELIGPTGARTLEPRVHAELAELAHLRGDEATREAEARQARTLFESVGAPALAERMVLYAG
jgi:class 3 adenylate cyclase/tetratricopeptide (TPR) repeat protein